MSMKTFSAVVSNGRLWFDESLFDLEGQQVNVTLSTPVSADTTPLPCRPVPPDESHIETHVVLPMPYDWKPITGDAVNAGPLRPSMILPKESPDE
jgi:hypothetical protein